MAISNWIGYSPFMYAHEKGWLRDSGIDSLFVTSLGEIVRLYRNDRLDGFAATQVEALKTRDAEIEPVIFLDLSEGGDSILSNVDIPRLLKTRQIPTYLEIDSVNSILLESFQKKYRFESSRFLLNNVSQIQIQEVANQADPFVIVSYEPYSSLLEKKGLKVLGSTRDLDCLILDALWIRKGMIRRRKRDLRKLISHLINARRVMRENPAEFYRTVSPYLEGQSYDDFQKGASSIRWLLDGVTDGDLQRFRKEGVNTDYALLPEVVP